MIKLQELRVHTNRLTGTIPSSFAHLTDVFVLEAQNNQLSGSIPTLHITRMSKLTGFCLQNNNLVCAPMQDLNKRGVQIPHP